MTTRIGRIGAEGAPLLLIDGVSRDVGPLIGAARAATFGGGRGPYYPGVRAPAPSGYAAGLATGLAPALGKMFGWKDARFEVVSCDFSLVTTPPSDLTLIQRLPHFDGTDAGVVAVLHYLCGPEHGGTAFFRHRSTGFEHISADRHARYDAALREDLAREGTPGARYHAGSDRVFEETARIPAAFDRLIAYSGRTLHSGLVPEDAALSGDPASGRLTVNTFLRIVPTE